MSILDFLAKGGAGVVRKAAKAGDVMDALMNYALITGSVGGLTGMALGVSLRRLPSGRPSAVRRCSGRSVRRRLCRG